MAKKRSERISAYAVEILVERNNKPMLIIDLRDALGEYLNSAYLPNQRGLSQILQHSYWFIIEGGKKRTYKLRPDVYKKLSSEAARS